MKKYSILLTIALVAIVFCVNAEAATDKTASVSASVSITGTTSMSITAPSPATISWSSTSTDAFPSSPADQKIVIAYSSNYNPWKVDIYTNNTQVPLQASGGKYAKGGLSTSTGSNVIPCKWVAKVGTNTVVPTVPSMTSLHNFIKDKRDEDDPATTTQDESWGTAFTAGYANIAFGGPTGGYCVDPTNNAPGPNQYKGDAVNGSVAVYVAGLFGTGGATSAGDYTSSIYFDLYHE